MIIGLPEIVTLLALISTVLPNERNNLHMVKVSRNLGILRISQTPSVSKVAAKIGKVAFFDPLTLISPFKGFAAFNDKFFHESSPQIAIAIS